MTFFQSPQVIFVLFVFVYYNYSTFIAHLWPTFPNQEKFDPLGNFVQHCVCVWGGGWKDIGVNSSDVDSVQDP